MQGLNSEHSCRPLTPSLIGRASNTKTLARPVVRRISEWEHGWTRTDLLLVRMELWQASPHTLQQTVRRYYCPLNIDRVKTVVLTMRRNIQTLPDHMTLNKLWISFVSRLLWVSTKVHYLIYTYTSSPCLTGDFEIEVMISTVGSRCSTCLLITAGLSRGIKCHKK